jgi:hypothetical protein
MFLERKEARLAEKKYNKMKAENSQLTFKPSTLQAVDGSAPSSKMTAARASNFWERNLAFIEKKDKRIEKLDQRFNKELTFKPKILPKSREMSLGSDRSRSTIRSRPWLNVSRGGLSNSKDSIPVQGVLSARG